MHKPILFAVCTGLVLGAAFACSSSNDIVPFGGGSNEDASPGTFIPPADAGEGGVAIPVEASTALAEQCVSTDCPAPFASCATGSGTLPDYKCSVDTSSDVDNCGGCGRICPTGTGAYNFRAACVNGECQPFCQEGFSDCNGIPDDGCESSPQTDPNNCGICGIKCGPGVDCIEGKCGCPPGQTNCNGTCVDLKTDDGNCGTCGTVCMDHQPDGGTPPPHMFYGCDQSQCNALKCIVNDSVFWSDCNHTQTDGCEVDLRQPNLTNCGACGNACTPGQQCFSQSDTGMDCQCKGGKTLCGEGSCADLENDPRNCGSCGYVCPQADNEDLVCTHGICGLSPQPGRADCNGRTEDGAEVDLMKDPRNCGACGNSCDTNAGQPCVGGQCVTHDCDAGPVK